MSETVHASTVAIERAGKWHGVLLTGRSGAGKSDLAMRLIDRGARLVADDYTDVTAAAGVLIATPPSRIAGRIEVRGIGIVEMPHLPQASVALVVALDEPVARMPEPRVRRIDGIDVPLIALPPLEASTALKVEMALDRWGAAA